MTFEDDRMDASPRERMSRSPVSPRYFLNLIFIQSVGFHSIGGGFIQSVVVFGGGFIQSLVEVSINFRLAYLKIFSLFFPGNFFSEMKF